MPFTKSPLRYPGGKTQLLKFVEHTIKLNHLQNPTYCEAFSGGAGIAIALLLSNQINSIILNDFDIAIYSFWYAILNNTTEFIEEIRNTPVTLDTWYEEKKIYNKLKNSTTYNFRLAFATFFLNRTNIAGIITGGPIGGFKQASKYNINCRFNKNNLIEKIQNISQKKNQIELYHLDAVDLIYNILMQRTVDSIFIYFDPPYYKQGKKLYKNAFDDNKHTELSKAIRAMNDYQWIATYDNNLHIENLYHDMDIKRYSLRYSANKIRREQEIFFHSPVTKIESFDTVLFT